MTQKVQNSDRHVLSFENNTLEILDLESQNRSKVEKVYYHNHNELYLFMIDGMIMHNFILDDKAVKWLEDKIEIL